MGALTTVLTVPDIWQQKAVNLLRAGFDVIVDAPTGAGKTFIFESLIRNDFQGKAVFTVPTRALANDKLREWTAKGWNVGISTGDVSYNTDAPIVVATLETQKRALVSGRGPRLLVIDEYQMLGDAARGVSYEIAIAMAPASTQLLLLSGSVANPGEVERWLKRCGREAVCIHHPDRPVPLDEVHLEALPDRLPKTVRGRWPRYIGRALAAELGPILIFAPRRKVAESLARSLAAALPESDPLQLSAEQKGVAGVDLARCLKNRVGFHHSGMSYAQRSDLVETLAKQGALKVIVATTGLGAGINFSMRSVLVLEREYRVAEAHRLLRPDELLQMFGRAGRRGLDERGSVLYVEDKPRLMDARPRKLSREAMVDWPALLMVIQAAVAAGRPPLAATRTLMARLFSREPIRLGLDDFLSQRASVPAAQLARVHEQQLASGTVTEFKNSEGIWERRRGQQLFALKDTWYLDGAHWRAGLSSPKIVASLRIGTVCRFGKGRERRYGLEVPLAVFPKEVNEDRLQLSKWFIKVLREQAREAGRKPNVPKLWSLEHIESQLLPQMPQLARGGCHVALVERGNVLYTSLDYSEAQIHAFKDLSGKGLLNPIERKRSIAGTDTEPRAGQQLPQAGGRSVAEQWYALGLVDRQARPTRRGIIFSFFNHGEGLALAAGLEATQYPIEEFYYDLANLRCGHRFHSLALAGRPLAALCQEAYGLRSIPGYLRRGLPEDYGDGASEILYNLEHKARPLAHYLSEELSRGDIERARIEWRSLCAQIATAPDYAWDRWRELRQYCAERLQG